MIVLPCELQGSVCDSLYGNLGEWNMYNASSRCKRHLLCKTIYNQNGSSISSSSSPLPPLQEEEISLFNKKKAAVQAQRAQSEREQLAKKTKK